MTDFNKFVGAGHGGSEPAERRRGYIWSMAVHAVALVVLGTAKNYPSAPPRVTNDSLILLIPPPRKILQPAVHRYKLRPVKVGPALGSSHSLPSPSALLATARPASQILPAPEIASSPSILARVPLATLSFVPALPIPAPTTRALTETGQFASRIPQVASAAHFPAVQNAGFDSSRSTAAPHLPDLHAGPSQFNDSERNISGTIHNPGIVRPGAFSSSTTVPQPAAIARAVLESGFGSTASAKPRQTQTAIRPAVPEGIRILDWPRLPYTAEARARQIEGDVLLETIFTSEGEVRILRLVHGLGYGLDENAVIAARAIRFAPARRDGRAVDLHGIIRLTFHLAY